MQRSIIGDLPNCTTLPYDKRNLEQKQSRGVKTSSVVLGYWGLHLCIPSPFSETADLVAGYPEVIALSIRSIFRLTMTGRGPLALPDDCP